jgi:hypothetical protein
MQTTGATLLAVFHCSPPHVRTPAQDSRRAHGLLYSPLYGDTSHELSVADHELGIHLRMEPVERGNSSDFYGLRPKRELLTVLRQAGIDLLAYDGALCSDVALPLAEAVRRIKADPALRSLFRRVVGCEDDMVSAVTENLIRVAQNCAERPTVMLRVYPMDDLLSVT